VAYTHPSESPHANENGFALLEDGSRWRWSGAWVEIIELTEPEPDFKTYDGVPDWLSELIPREGRPYAVGYKEYWLWTLDNPDDAWDSGHWEHHVDATEAPSIPPAADSQNDWYVFGCGQYWAWQPENWDDPLAAGEWQHQKASTAENSRYHEDASIVLTENNGCA